MDNENSEQDQIETRVGIPVLKRGEQLETEVDNNGLHIFRTPAQMIGSYGEVQFVLMKYDAEDIIDTVYKDGERVNYIDENGRLMTGDKRELMKRGYHEVFPRFTKADRASLLQNLQLNVWIDQAPGEIFGQMELVSDPDNPEGLDYEMPLMEKTHSGRPAIGFFALKDEETLGKIRTNISNVPTPTEEVK